MANIPSNIDKINDIEVSSEAPLTEALMNKIGADINALIDLSGFANNSQSFTASGTFNVPENVSSVFVEMIGGGGAGAENGGGGAGAPRVVGIASVTPLSAISVTVGAGGAGGFEVGSGNHYGGNGGDSSFGGLLTSKGAQGGRGKSNNFPLDTATEWFFGGDALPGGAKGGDFGGVQYSSRDLKSGGDSDRFPGGASTAGTTAGGGASWYGPGGAGIIYGATPGNAPPAGAYGAGGSSASSGSHPGGNGAPGFVKVWW